MPLPESYLRRLEQDFHLNRLRPDQEQVLAAVAAEKNVLAVLPTGAGKSLCFQLPCAAEEGLTLCVSPLIALMRDQVAGLRRRGIAWAGATHSLQTADEKSRVLRAIRDGRCRLLYIAPERLRHPALRSALESRGVRRLVVDEAHCLSAWGHDFRSDYRLLPAFWQELGRPQLLTFTATAGPEVRRDLHQVFGGLEEIHVPINRPNLSLRVKEVGFYGARQAYLAKMLQNRGPSIVYCLSRRDSEEVAQELDRRGLRTAAYHAGLAGEERNRAQQLFQEGGLDAMVATTAFGMGVDKRDIRQVVHAGVPFGVEHYWQEVGRAGRDGKAATATLLWSSDALSRTDRLLEQETPTAEHFRCAWKAAEETPGMARPDFQKALALNLKEARLPALTESLLPAILGPLYDAGALAVDGRGGFHAGPQSSWKAAEGTALRRQQLRWRSLRALEQLAESSTCRVQAVGQFLQLPARSCHICDNCRRG
jgi:ATP-dependent DNA helicase RecQ